MWQCVCVMAVWDDTGTSTEGRDNFGHGNICIGTLSKEPPINELFIPPEPVETCIKDDLYGARCHPQVTDAPSAIEDPTEPGDCWTKSRVTLHSRGTAGRKVGLFCGLGSTFLLPLVTLQMRGTAFFFVGVAMCNRGVLRQRS